MSATSSANQIAQEQFNMALVEMFVEDMQPVATVERTGFKKFCSLVAPKCEMPSRRTLNRRLEDLYNQKKAHLISSLSGVAWMSATADIWSAHKRAYMGVTLNYVNHETIEMESIALGCRRFRGSHTGEAIAKCLRGIFDEYGVTSRILNVVTDNATNFSKAFSLVVESDRVDSTNMDSAMEGESNELEVLEIGQLLHDFESDMDDELLLPPQKRCGNHTLNLVARSDSLKARGDNNYKRLYDRAMAKVTALSNAVSRSPKNADTVEELTGSTFLNPTVTRWSSDYYAVERITTIGLEKVTDCQRALSQNVFSETEFQFLKSYLKVMQPIVKAMDLFQSQKCFIGHIVPTIIGIKHQLSKMSERSTIPLVKALLDGLEARFDEIINTDEFNIASALIPLFKLKFLPETKHMEVKKKLLVFVQDVDKECSSKEGMISKYQKIVA